MSNIKKIIGVVLALVMALSVVTVAFAAGNEAYSVAFTVVDNKTTIDPGESATVEVRVTANYNVSAMSIPVFFDNTKVTVTATAAESLTGAKIITEESDGAETYFANSGHTKDDYGVRALVYIATFGADITSYDNALVMTLTVTANENASGAVVLECLETTIKTADNPSGTLYVLKNANPDSTTVDSMGQVIDAATITNATATINIGGATAEPVLSGINGGVVGDNTTSKDMTGYVYGIPVGTTDLTQYFSVENGTFTVTETAKGLGTGTTLQVYDNAGQPVGEPYTVIIFGDVDGNGSITANDYIAVKFATLTTPLEGAFAVAADVDCKNGIVANDYINVKFATLTKPLSQNPFI